MGWLTINGVVLPLASERRVLPLVPRQTVVFDLRGINGLLSDAGALSPS